MKYEERKPPEQLAPFVQCFWYLEKDYMAPDHEEVLWPDGCFELIYHFGAKYRVNNQHLDTAFVIGSLTHHHRLTADGPIRLFGIRLKPWGLKFFLDADIKALRDKFVSQSELFHKSEIDKMIKKLENLDLEEGMAALIEYMSSSFNESNLLDKDFIPILTELYEAPVELDLHSIVSMSHYSQRQFERKVLELTGLSPKKTKQSSKV